MAKTYIVVDKSAEEYLDILSASTLEEARKQAIDFCCEGYERETEPVWVDYELYEADQIPDNLHDGAILSNQEKELQDNIESGSIRLIESDTLVTEPPAPKCKSDEGEHRFVEYSVVGNGGGVIIRDECKYCKVRKVTDTWAQKPDSGEQGYTTVTYEIPESEYYY